MNARPGATATRHRVTRAAFFAAASLHFAAASAQTVQRCESPEGKVTYSNTTCPTGTSSVKKIEPDPGPTEADQKAARDRAQQHSRELDKLERQRQKDDEKAARARAAAEARQTKKEAECRKLDARVRAARAEFEDATLARRQQADRKLRLAEEQAAACRKS